MTQATIVAPATPRGIGGIAVVRISGPQAKEILGKLLNNNDLPVPISHKAVSVFNIFDGSGTHIDNIVCTYFKSPSSFTGEDVLELSCHGSPIIVDKIVATCIAFGAKLAEPGEFTRRAFVNGKMDLIQAESVASLIHAKSEESSALNLKLLTGELSKKFIDIQTCLIKASSLVELELDISEEDLQPNLISQITELSDYVDNAVAGLLNTYKLARLLNYGALVVIAGEPNVGKSTLLNALSESDRAITSSRPGTTRDAIDVPLLLDGVPINLVDTAGIRKTDEEVESEGVRRTYNYLNRADLIISVTDISQPAKQPLSTSTDVPIIDVLNKIDLLSGAPALSFGAPREYCLSLSAKTGEGVKELKAKIKETLGISNAHSDTISITTSRQHAALTGCQKNIDAVKLLLRENPVSLELMSIELGEALENIGLILGKTTPNDILNNIFNQFCVGK